jgi:hypothetical protein
MISCKIILETRGKYEHSVKKTPDICLCLSSIFKHAKTQAHKQTHVRMQAKYTRTSSLNDRHSTEIYCRLTALLYLIVLKSDVAKSVANI